MQLKNRTILITGGATGIGYALSRQLLENYNRVIICGRKQDRLDRARLELPTVETIRCDINDADDLNNLTSLLGARYPQLDTLINNAGIQQQIDLTAGQTTDWQIANEISTNLTSHINITQRLYTLLSANRHPAIVFIGSALGIVPKYQAPVYSAAKAGLHSFIQSLRFQARQDRMRIVEVFPDVVDTAMTQTRKNETRMSPDKFATALISQLEKNKPEIYIGRTKILSLLHRFSPGLALNIMNKPRSADNRIVGR
jgi:uncharacterized oxidoreductase